MGTTYLILLGCLMILGPILIIANGGFFKHIYFAFTNLLYFQYLYVGALQSTFSGKVAVLGVDISSEIEEGMLFYCLGTLSYLCGYWFTYSKYRKGKPLFSLNLPFDSRALIKITLFFLILNYAGRFVGLGVGGSVGTYIDVSQDFLIPLTIALYLRKVNPIITWTIVVLTLLLFSFNFFRFRIYLTVFGLILIYIYNTPNIFKNLWKYALIAMFGYYMVMFSTVNRQSLADLDFENVVFNVWKGDSANSDLLVEQSTNIHADFTVFKYYNENPLAQHDHGLTMLVYPFIRAIPSNFFENGTKPYPPPSLALIINAYGNTRAAATAGRAVSNIGELYIAFGLPGIIAGMFAFGVILQALQRRWVWDESLNSLGQMAILLSMFQYITRGYFPQFTEHIIYLFLPVLMIRYFSKTNFDGNIIRS